jgi:hypothetical protein
MSRFPDHMYNFSKHPKTKFMRPSTRITTLIAGHIFNNMGEFHGNKDMGKISRAKTRYCDSLSIGR